MSYNRNLLQNGEIYSIALVNETIPRVSKWHQMSWRTREHTMRRHHTVMFLCNTTPLSDQAMEISEEAGPSHSSAGTSRSHHSDENMEEGYRYKPLFLNPKKHAISAELGVEFGEEADIYDVETKSEIYVVFEHEGMRSKKTTLNSASKTVIVDLSSGDIYFSNMDRMEPGYDKASDFLSRRRLTMLEGGMRIDETDVDVSFKDLVTHDSLLEKSTKEWIETFWGLKLMSNPRNYESFSLDLQGFGLKLFLDKMEDTTSRKEEIIKWKGKILPPTWVSPLKSTSDKDSIMVKEFINAIGQPIGQDQERKEIITSLLRVNNEFDEINNFRFIEANSIDHVTIREAVGIGHKKSVRDESCETTRELEYSTPSPLKYHPWFDELMRDLSCQIHPIGTSITLDFSADNNNLYYHEVDRIAVGVSDKLLGLYKQTNSSLFAAVITNFYSRLGGSYRIKEKKSNDWIMVMPLYYKTGDQERWVQGIVLIAPQHNRTASDKITFVTIERLKITKRNIKYFELALPFPLYETSNGVYYIRRNSTNREDCEFRTFIHSSLFLVANTVGEMCMNSPDVLSNADMYEMANIFINDNAKWIAERIAENVMMGIIGGSQEEGMLAMLRKLFMLLYAKEKNRMTLMYSINEFMEKVNECAISSPLALYFHKCFRQIMGHMVNDEANLNA